MRDRGIPICNMTHTSIVGLSGLDWTLSVVVTLNAVLHSLDEIKYILLQSLLGQIFNLMLLTLSN